jgi:hypothetical protein
MNTRLALKAERVMNAWLKMRENDYPPELMVANVVPDLVNNPRFDSAACIVQM